LRRPLGRADGAEDAVLEVERLPPPAPLDRELAEASERDQMAAVRLEDLAIHRRRVVGATEPSRILGALKELGRRGVVCHGLRRRAEAQETPERDTEIQDRTDGDGQLHGRDDSRGAQRGSATEPGTASPWPSAPLPRSPAGNRCSRPRKAGRRAGFW